MARQKTYIEKPLKKGVMTVELSSWKYFHDYIRKEMLYYPHFIWRGQRDASWDLDSSLDRAFGKAGVSPTKDAEKKHLELFKLSSRGRRGRNPPKDMDENEWWALGQHHGLATPLLDWTEAPFVALYFAFEKNEKSQSGKRAVWSLATTIVRNEKILEQTKEPQAVPLLQLIRPQQDENARLVNQAGLFTRAPIGKTVKTWIEHYCKGIDDACLLKIVMPDSDRENCLRTLNRMNINHTTLFPDLYGAGQYCNKTISIKKY
jgi:hypothetical protein